jgi:hypothetical protein
MEFLLLLILLQFKHWYADFCIQTYDQTVKKGIYGDPVGLSHSLDHMSWTLVALVVFSFFHTIHPAELLALSLAEAAVHYHIDYLKVKFGIKDITKPRYWREFGLDQLAHQLTYVAIIWYILLR